MRPSAKSQAQPVPVAQSLQAPLVYLRNAVDSFRDTPARLGQYVLANPEKVIRQSVSELAELTRSSEASVVRFCRLLGYAGFREFKLALTSELSRSPLGVGRHTDEDVGQRIVDSVLTTRAALDPGRLDAAARLLLAARRIDIFGSGISGVVAQLASYRFMRLGLVAAAFQDPVFAHEVMTGLDGDCVALGISESGATPATVEFLRRAKAGGGVTIAITSNLGSEIAKAADVLLLAMPVRPLPVGGDISPAASKIYVLERLAQYMIQLQGADAA